jgi:hypothetical protein
MAVIGLEPGGTIPRTVEADSPWAGLTGTRGRSVLRGVQGFAPDLGPHA